MTRDRLTLSVRGTLRFCILLFVTVFLWWFFRSYFLWIALLLIVIGAAASVFLLWRKKDGIRVRMELPDGCAARGKAFPFSIIVSNKSRFIGFGAMIEYRWGNAFTQGYQTKRERIWISPRKGARITQQLESVYAGRIEAELTRFVVCDAFHIVEYAGCPGSGSWTMIYPVPNIGEEDRLSAVVHEFPDEEETKKRGTEYNPDYEVREYIEGDELKSIHWKLTAKREHLMVRERLAAGKEKINVLLPLGQDKEQNDRLMDAFSGVCALLIEKGYPVQIFWMGMVDALQSGYAAEQGELDGITAEILSMGGLKQPGAAEQQMALVHPGESYILIQTGAYQGAYVRN